MFLQFNPYYLCPRKAPKTIFMNKSILRTVFILCMVFSQSLSAITFYSGVKNLDVEDESKNFMSSNDVQTSFDERTGSLTITFWKNAKHIDINIKKDGRKYIEDKQDVVKGQQVVYQLSDFGEGIYVITTGSFQTGQVIETVVFHK